MFRVFHPPNSQPNNLSILGFEGYHNPLSNSREINNPRENNPPAELRGRILVLVIPDPIFIGMASLVRSGMTNKQTSVSRPRVVNENPAQGSQNKRGNDYGRPFFIKHIAPSEVFSHMISVNYS